MKKLTLIKNAGPEIDTNWRLSLLNRHNPQTWPDFGLAYRTWKDCWYDVYRSIDKSHLAHSNAFTESDITTALFYQDKCAALLIHRLVDLSEEIWRDDNYFAPWPETALRELSKNGKKIMICSHYTVDKEFRQGGKFQFPYTVKDFIAGVSFRYFLSTPALAMTGNMRNAKGVQKSFYKWGATALMTDVPCNGETSDLVGVFRDKVNLQADPLLSPLVSYVWEKCAREQGSINPLPKAA